LAIAGGFVTFMRQSAIINQLARQLVKRDSNALTLDEEFKEQLQKRINNHREKN